MKDPNCTQCQEWEICPFHPADEAPVTERLPEPAAPAKPKLSFAELRRRVANPPAATTEESMREWIANDPKLLLLGPDDPEVSSDLIYLDEATGGLVGVPPVNPYEGHVTGQHATCACSACQEWRGRACVDAALDRAMRDGLVSPAFPTGAKVKVSI